MDVPPPAHRKADHDALTDRPGLMIARPKRLSVKMQITLLIALSALLVVALLLRRVLPVGEPGARTEEQAAQTVAANSFKPTPRQWAGFAIAPVRDIAFRPVQDADGKIAFDDDLTTAVFSPFTGRVSRLFARTGDRVKRGDPLAAIQATEFVQAQNDVISALASLKTARAQFNLAQTNEKRQHALYLAQGGALKDWQQSQVDLSTAEGALHSAEIALGAVRNRLRIMGRTDQQIDSLQNAPDTMTLSPEALIVAPINGIITQRQIGLGQNVVSQSNGGSTPLFSISDLSKVWLLANVREADASLIHIGDAAEVSVPAYPGRVFTGRISYVGSSIDPLTHRLAVHAEVDSAALLLKPEMLASFRIITGSAVVSPSVPEGALVYEGDKVHVWVANDAAKTITLREIKIGRIDAGMVQVLDGLRPGEKVVTAGSLFLDRAVTGD